MESKSLFKSRKLPQLDNHMGNRGQTRTVPSHITVSLSLPRTTSCKRSSVRERRDPNFYSDKVEVSAIELLSSDYACAAQGKARLAKPQNVSTDFSEKV